MEKKGDKILRVATSAAKAAIDYLPFVSQFIKSNKDSSEGGKDKIDWVRVGAGAAIGILLVIAYFKGWITWGEVEQGLETLDHK